MVHFGKPRTLKLLVYFVLFGIFFRFGCTKENLATLFKQAESESLSFVQRWAQEEIVCTWIHTFIHVFERYHSGPFAEA
jgi:hypothetical protein